MNTAEALAVVREALEPRTGETLYADHPKVRGLAALALIEKRVEEWERMEERWHSVESKVLMHDDALARAEKAEAERDEYRFWNERVRVCSEHTAEVADGSGDCLVCRVAELEAALESVRSERDDELFTERNRVAELEEALRRITAFPYVNDGAALRMSAIARRALGGGE